MKTKEQIQQKIIFTEKLITSVNNQLNNLTDEDDEQWLLRDRETLNARKRALEWVLEDKEATTEKKYFED